MNNTNLVNKATILSESKEQVKQQIAQYSQKLPASKQAFYKRMKYLEAVSVGIILAAFTMAMYFSIAWKSVNPLFIPTAWFAFAGSGSLLLALTGAQNAILGVYPIGILAGSKQKLLTGSGAMWIGLLFISGSLVNAAFWGLFIYATWTANFEILRPLIGFLGVVMGVGIVISMLFTTFQKIFKSR